MTNRRQVAYTLPDALVDDIKHISKTTAIPMSRLVERALVSYINEHYPPALPKTPRTTHVNVDPTNRELIEQLKKDKAGYPVFTKDLRPYHQQSAHLFTEGGK